MALSNAIPTEIIEVIIDYLHDDRMALRATSLASTPFLSRSQMHLFSDLWVALAPNQDSLTRLRRLYDTFLKSPHLTLYVQDAYLTWYINEAWSTKNDELLLAEEIIPLILRLLQRVRRVSLAYLSQLRVRRGSSQRGQWRDQPEAVKSAVLEFCRHPSVIEINISHIRDFPVSILASCSGLKKLSLRGLDFNVYNARNIELDLEETIASRARTQTQLDTLEIDQYFGTFFPLVAQAFGHPNSTIGLSRIRALKIVGSLPNGTHPVWKDINHFMPSLECLMWNQAVDWEGRTVISKFYAEPLNLIQMKNLRYLILTFLADVNKYGIIPNLDWLAESLDRLRGDNRIEEITVVLIYESWNKDNTNALLTVWTRRLDAIISSAGFPVLRRVRIILPDFADRVGRFTAEIKPQLGLRAGEYFQIEPHRNNTAAIWKRLVARAPV